VLAAKGERREGTEWMNGNKIFLFIFDYMVNLLDSVNVIYVEKIS
jgi:hypothetical protein